MEVSRGDIPLFCVSSFRGQGGVLKEMVIRTIRQKGREESSRELGGPQNREDSKLPNY